MCIYVYIYVYINQNFSNENDEKIRIIVGRKNIQRNLARRGKAGGRESRAARQVRLEREGKNKGR